MRRVPAFLQTLGMAVLAAVALSACREAPMPQASTVGGASNDTAVLGAPGKPDSLGLKDHQGLLMAPPPLPTGVRAQVVRAAPDTAMALWVQDGSVHVASHAPSRGWSPAQVLEDIHGDASDAQLASNGQGLAMAIWQHTVGSIESLRFSRWQAGTGWSLPDVMPGALPRPHGEPGVAAHAPPRLRLDAQGNAWASWPSGFDENQWQASRFVAGQGWSRAEATTVAEAEASRAVTARP